MRGLRKTAPFAQTAGGLLAVMFFCSLLPAQNAKQIAGATPGSPVKYAGVLYKSANHRDPFLNPLLQKKDPKIDEEIARGTPPPGITGTYISQAALQGVAIREDGRVAVVLGADKRAYFIRQGDRLFDGYVKAIDSDSITLVRETKMRSGKVLNQEIVKRLRTP